MSALQEDPIRTRLEHKITAKGLAVLPGWRRSRAVDLMLHIALVVMTAINDTLFVSLKRFRMRLCDHQSRAEGN